MVGLHYSRFAIALVDLTHVFVPGLVEKRRWGTRIEKSWASDHRAIEHYLRVASDAVKRFQEPSQERSVGRPP